MKKCLFNQGKWNEIWKTRLEIQLFLFLKTQLAFESLAWENHETDMWQRLFICGIIQNMLKSRNAVVSCSSLNILLSHGIVHPCFCRTRMQMQIYPLLFNFQRSIWQFMTKWNKVWHFLQEWKLCSGLFNASFPYLCHLKIFNVTHSYLKLHNQCKLLIRIIISWKFEAWI